MEHGDDNVISYKEVRRRWLEKQIEDFFCDERERQRIRNYKIEQALKKHGSFRKRNKKIKEIKNANKDCPDKHD